MQYTILSIVWLKKLNIAVLWWTKHFNKEPVMTKRREWKFQELYKCRICENDYVDNYVKVRDHCHITGKYGGSAYRD